MFKNGHILKTPVENDRLLFFRQNLFKDANVMMCVMEHYSEN